MSESPTKIAKDFIHSGLGYSPGRRGMLVVDNNAVGISPIPCNPYQVGQKLTISKSTSKLFSTGLNYNSTSNISSKEKNKIIIEAMKPQKKDKVARNIQAIRTVQDIKSEMETDRKTISNQQIMQIFNNI